MAEEETGGINIPPIHAVLITESAAVALDGVEPALLTFAAQLAYLHFLLFGIPLRITRGRETHDETNPLRIRGRALDFAVTDKTGEETLVFLSILTWAAQEQNCRVWREYAGPGVPHICLEYHGA